MIRRSTLVVLIILAALIAFAFYLRNQKGQQGAAATPTTSSTSRPLFAASEGSVTEIRVLDSAGISVDLARDQSGKWVLKAPKAADADQAAAEAAATQVTALHVLSTPQLTLDIAGLSQPAYIMTFTFSTGKTHKLAVGAETPIQDGYYTSLDSGPIQIVDLQGLDALIKLLTQPPYPATPTPIATATSLPATSSSGLSGSETPSGTGTPPGTGTPAAATTTPTATP